MFHREELVVQTTGRGTYEISGGLIRIINASGIRRGLCHVFCSHTSASLTITENADPAVRRDLERALSRLAPDGTDYEHDAEGPDDMSAHIRSVLTRPDLVIPLEHGTPALGTWQGVYLWEHRRAGHRRSLLVTVIGE